MTAMQPRSREEAKRLGLPDWQIDQMFPGGMDIEGGLLGAPQPQQGFWQGGDKFRARDGLAGLLAVVGDALSRNSGGEGYATKGLMGGRLDAMEMARKKAEGQQALAEMMAVGQANGLRPEQVRAQALGLKLPQAPEPPPMVRDVRAWQQMSPEDKRAAQEMYSTRSPWRVMGQDGLPYQMNGGAGGPPPGTVEDGHQFMGGDPSDPKNWTPIGGGTGNGAGGF